MNNEYFENLSWSKPKKLQQEAIEHLAELDEKMFYMLIQPGDKENWENAALVLEKIGYPRVRICIDDLMLWLRDMNWPGASVISTLLLSFPKDELLEYINTAKETAIREQDEMWLYWLDHLLEETQKKI